MRHKKNINMTKLFFYFYLISVLFGILFFILNHLYLAVLCGAPAYIFGGLWAGRYINKGWR